MKLALGLDLVSIDRIRAVMRRHPERFLTRHFTPAERALCGDEPIHLAGRWAAKEAASKALGTGIGDVGWHDLEVVATPDRAPRLQLHGRARRMAEVAGWVDWQISISHTHDHAAAVVTAIASPAGWSPDSEPGHP